MKRVVFFIIFSIIILFTGCVTTRVSDVYNLSVGMTPNEVGRIMGQPVRILSTSYTQDGMFEVFEYQTYRNESYAVEFLNGRMTGYDSCMKMYQVVIIHIIPIIRTTYLNLIVPFNRAGHPSQIVRLNRAGHQNQVVRVIIRDLRKGPLIAVRPAVLRPAVPTPALQIVVPLHALQKIIRIVQVQLALQ